MSAARQADHPIDRVFLDRWSPRSFDASRMPEADLLTILEAARWAPSAFNIQPWRFLYARRDTAHWPDLLAALNPFNRSWAHSASALVLVISDTLWGQEDRPLRPSEYNSFDTGIACAHIALQACMLGYQAHAMAGLDLDVARVRLSIPDRYRVEVAIAVGRQADPAGLPDDLRDREWPSDRKPLSELAVEGPFHLDERRIDHAA